MKQFSIAALAAAEAPCFDVCIIGCGPAGIAIARELSGSRLSVCIVESGDFERQPAADALNAVESIGWPRIEDQWLVRNRIVGGSSHTWSGRCVPFDEIDFEPRAWVPFSGWPVQRAELTPFLDRAAPHLGISMGSGYAGEHFWRLAQRERPVPPFDNQKLETYFWAFSRDPENARDHMRSGRHLQSWLGENITLVTNATVCRINMTAAGDSAKSLRLAAPDGTRHLLAAGSVVLCAGGIENPRLLLCSGEGQAPGNAYDQLGRYLMDHLRGPVAAFPLQGTRRLRRQFGHFRWADGQVFAHGMQLSPALQRQEGLLNCTAWLEGRITADDPYNALKRWAKLRPQLPGDATTILANLGLLASGLRDYAVSRNGLPRKIDQLALVAMCEQLPDPESRVTLSEMPDRFGVPRARVDWRVHEIETLSLQRMARLVAQEFERLGLPAPELSDWVRDAAPLPASFQDVAHPMGATRMGVDPANSVVDADCRVWGTRNLYVAGSSVFPTSSHANPTQMIVALAIRLADRLKLSAGAQTLQTA
jgi:choline dehydrogenase-like flavoprotein